MAKNGFKIVDSDLHVMEPSNLYEDYIEPKFRDVAPKWVIGPEGGRGGWQVQDAQRAAPEWARKQMVSRQFLTQRKEQYYVSEHEQGYTPTLALRAMDVEGIDTSILFRSFSQMAIHVEGQDPAYSLAVCKAFNNWLADFAKADPKRLKGSANLALNDIPAAAEEAKRAVKDLGMVSVTVLPSVMDDRMPHDPECDQLWATLQDMNIPVTFHDTSGGYSPRNPGNWFREHPNNLVLSHTFSFPLTLMMAVGCMAAGGVLQRFPRLKVGFLEGNCSWVPWLLYRLDEQWEIFGEGQDTPLAQLPSEYFKDRCYVSVESDGELLDQVVGAIGDDNIVISTDYPHSDANYPFAMEKFLAYDKVSYATKKKILWDNCVRLYDL